MESRLERIGSTTVLVAMALSVAGWWFGYQLHPIEWVMWLAPWLNLVALAGLLVLALLPRRGPA